MKRIITTISLVFLLSMPCYAIKAMMFNSIDQYIDGADGIWIVEVVKQSGEERSDGSRYEAKILQTLKGEPDKETLTVCAISRQLTSGCRYLVFGLNRSAGGAWMDNGNISPVPVPTSFSLTELEGKSQREQIACIMIARTKEIERQVKQLSEEKEALEQGLKFQERLDKLPTKGKLAPNKTNGE